LYFRKFYESIEMMQLNTIMTIRKLMGQNGFSNNLNYLKITILWSSI
jgi:hypothetical protein